MNFTQVREYIRDLLAASFTNKQKLDKIDEDNNGFLIYNNTPVNSPQYGFTPVGTVISLMGNTAPANYLICDGTVYNIADYRALANYFEEQFGSSNHFGGDGITTFAVPDLRGEFLRGSGTNSRTNQGSGATVGTHQDATELAVTVGNTSSKIISIRGVPDGGNNIAMKKADSAIQASALSGVKYVKSPAGTVSNPSVDTNNVYITLRPTNTSILYCIAYKNIYMGGGGGSDYTAGDGIDITDDTISIDEMPSTDMSEIVYPKPTIPTRKVKYSTEEQVVGEWIDGKPLYQKTFSCGALPNASSKSIMTNLVNVEAKNCFGYAFQETGDRHMMPLPFIGNPIQNSVTMNIMNDGSTIGISTGVDRTSFTQAYVTVQYTKTTD